MSFSVDLRKLITQYALSREDADAKRFEQVFVALLEEINIDPLSITNASNIYKETVNLEAQHIVNQVFDQFSEL